MKNRWFAYALAEPPVEWRLELPDAGGPARHAIARAILDLADAHGIFTITAVDVEGAPALQDATTNAAWSSLAERAGVANPLPFAGALKMGEGRVAVASTIAVRDAAGAVVLRRAEDAGALLRELEPDLDDAWARRFAGHRPFCAPWSEVEGDRFVVSIGFWSDAFWQAHDDELRGANEARLVPFREALKALALQRRAVAALPVPPPLS